MTEEWDGDRAAATMVAVTGLVPPKATCAYVTCTLSVPAVGIVNVAEYWPVDKKETEAITDVAPTVAFTTNALASTAAPAAAPPLSAATRVHTTFAPAVADVGHVTVDCAALTLLVDTTILLETTAVDDTVSAAVMVLAPGARKDAVKAPTVAVGANVTVKLPVTATAAAEISAREVPVGFPCTLR